MILTDKSVLVIRVHGRDSYINMAVQEIEAERKDDCTSDKTSRQYHRNITNLARVRTFILNAMGGKYDMSYRVRDVHWCV